MPHALPAFIGWVGYAITGGLTAIGLSPYAAAAVLDFGIKLAALAGLAKISEKLFGIPDIGQSAQSFSITTRSTIEHQRIVYGETLVSGPIAYINTAGSQNQALYHAVVLAGHEIEDVTDIWLDDNEILSAAINWSGDGSVDSGWLRGTIAHQTTTYFDKFLGTSVQTASPDLNSAFADITSQHQGRGIAWFLTRTDYFTDQAQVWSAGAPNQYKALVRGKKVYDPRSDSTQPFGTGPHRVNSGPTWEWSDNPALCWADYMIDTSLGFGESTARIDYGYVASAANICEGVVYTPVGTDNRFRCNGALSTGDTYETNIDRILSAMNGMAVLLNGVWKVHAWGYVTPTISINEDMLRGDIRLQLSPNERSRFNTVRGYFIDKNRLWQPSQFPEATSSEYVSRDNDQTLYRDISLDMTKEVYAAQRLAFGILEQSDLETTAIIPTNFKTLPVEVAGTIKLSVEKMGWTDKEFRVMRYKLSDMGGIDLICREDALAAYTDVATNEYTVSSGGGYVTNDPGVPAPTSFYVFNRPNGIELTWVPPAARLYEYTEVYRNLVNSFGDTATELIDLSRINRAYDQPAQNQIYYYWIRARNFVGEVSSVVPDVSSGKMAVWADGYQTLNFDPGFEQTQIGDADETFWTNQGSWDLGSAGRAYISVVSEGLGTGESHIYRQDRWVNPGSYQIASTVTSMGNTKRVPVVRGATVAVHARWRVPTHTNPTTHWLTFDVIGHKSLHDIDAGATKLLSFAQTVVNSKDWDVSSNTYAVEGLTNITSYSYLSVSVSQFTNHIVADVSTTQTRTEVDQLFMRYI